MCIRDRFSNVHSYSFPLKSYIFNTLFLSVVPVVNKTLPVSYTHLDVYKRQAYTGSSSDYILFGKLENTDTINKINTILNNCSSETVEYLSLIHI